MSSKQQKPPRGFRGTFEWFFRSEVSGSLLLLAATITALIWANSPWAESYAGLLHQYLGLNWGDSNFSLTLHHWVNDGLMVIFFFVVGLEIKRELVVGQLSSARKAALPVAAAAGGMIVPALIYAALNVGGEGAAGWGIPMATDIAFALGILALFGTRAPIGLKIFLTALAIADDLGAVLVIAVFYTEKIRWGALGIAGLLLLVLLALFRLRVRRLGIIISVILGVWVAVFASGVHATVAGILVALMVPIRARIEPARFFEVAEGRLAWLRDTGLSRTSMLCRHEQVDALEEIHTAVSDMRPVGLSLEHYLHPVQAWLILPLFALFNAGVAINADAMSDVVAPVSLGIVLGLFVGKPLGVAVSAWLAIKLGLADLPEGVSWGQIVGAGMLAGVGFTMSLFIGALAFPDATMVAQAKIGILVASLLSAVAGWAVLHKALPKARD